MTLGILIILNHQTLQFLQVLWEVEIEEIMAHLNLPNLQVEKAEGGITALTGSPQVMALMVGLQALQGHQVQEAGEVEEIHPILTLLPLPMEQ
jgi:hypothetical protein